MKRGIATFTLDYGTCPPWLFQRMVKLGRSITEILIDEYGPDEFIKRISDPVWFQAFGTVLAFDWNASGLTTILTAALKEAIRGQEKDLGIFICGGKGKTSRKTPDEILNWGRVLNLSPKSTNCLVYNSRMSAKVDSALIQDSYQIYHHSFFFSKNGAWTVVQQGMNTDTQTARRYHWYSEEVGEMVNEPHSGIAAQLTHNDTLNLTSGKSSSARDISTDLVSEGTSQLLSDIELIKKHATDFSKMAQLKFNGEELTLLKLKTIEFKHHPVEGEEFWNSPYLKKIFQKLDEKQPASYEALLATEGVGPKTVRALALVAEIIYGAKPSYEDPARYSFAHGGKDATPYPVDKPTYDQTIETLKNAVEKSRLNTLEKDKVLMRLSDK